MPKKPKNPAQKFLDALNFVKPIRKKKGGFDETHCMVVDNWLVASDSVITMGTPVDDNLTYCPHVHNSIAAFSKIREEVSIAQISEYELSVVSGNMRTVINCIPPGSFPIPFPDNPNPEFSVFDSLQSDLKLCYPIADEKSKKAFEAGVLVNYYGVTCTDSAAIVWTNRFHEIDDFPSFVIPKKAAELVGKHKFKISGIGGSEESVTFWFENGSFLRTKNFKTDYPNVLSVIENSPDDDYFEEIPKDFFDNVKTLKGFSKAKPKDALIHFSDIEISCDGARFEFESIGNADFLADKILKFKDFETFCFSEDGKTIYFKKPHCVGVLASFEPEESDDE